MEPFPYDFMMGTSTFKGGILLAVLRESRQMFMLIWDEQSGAIPPERVAILILWKIHQWRTIASRVSLTLRYRSDKRLD